MTGLREGLRRARSAAREHKWLGVLLAILTLAVTATGVLLSHGDRQRVLLLQSEGSVENLTRREHLAVNSTDAAAGDVVELVVQAINLGTEPLSNVAIEFQGLPTWGSSFVFGSCRIRVLPDPARRCDDGMREHDLHVDSLAPHRRLQVRARYVVEQPPCARDSIAQSSRADSDETAVTGWATTTIRYELAREPPACGSSLARTFAAIPTPIRGSCRHWYDPERPQLARVSCWPAGPTDYAVYELHPSREEARHTFADYVAFGEASGCGSLDAGSHRSSGPNGSFRYACTYEDGKATVTWLDATRHVIGYAGREDDDLDALLAWWTSRLWRVPPADAKDAYG